MRSSRIPVVVVLVWLVMLAHAGPAVADRGDLELRLRNDGDRASASLTGAKDSGTDDPGSPSRGTVPQDDDPATGNPESFTGGGAPAGAAPSGPTAEELWQKKVNRIQAENQALLDDYKRVFDTRNQLVAAGGCTQVGDCPGAQAPELTELPPRPQTPGGNDNADEGGAGDAPVYIPEISAEDAAYIAISTSLTVPTVEPGIGPEPHDNQWGMAVVGYPYWLYADGGTHVGPVSDSSSGLTVSLDATLDTVIFDMGDGTKINCDGTGTPYTSGAGANEESPTCGHVYEQTSSDQPGGQYTVTATAYWDVAYSTPVGSGTIPIVTSSERQITVGELQTVIER